MTRRIFLLSFLLLTGCLGDTLYPPEPLIPGKPTKAWPAMDQCIKEKRC